MPYRHKHSKAFTLIEVLIAIVVLAILATMIVPNMLDMANHAKGAEAIMMIGTIRRAVETYHNLKGDYINPSGQLSAEFDIVLGNWSDIGMSPPLSKNWSYCYTAFDHGGYAIDAWNFSSEPFPWISYNTSADGTYSGWTCNGMGGAFFKEVKDPSGNVIGCTI